MKLRELWFKDGEWHHLSIKTSNHIKWKYMDGKLIDGVVTMEDKENKEFTEQEKENILKEFSEKMSQQTDIPEKYRKIINENFDKLFME